MVGMSRNPWDLDLTTWWWIIWMAWFAVGEYLGAKEGNEMFTHHMWWIRNWAGQRGATIVVFLFFAILAWLNWHFILEGWAFFQELRG